MSDVLTGKKKYKDAVKEGVMYKTAAKVVKKAKQNYNYFKAGVAEEMKTNTRLIRIKHTPENYRTKEDIDFMESQNKTKHIKSKRPK